MTKSPHYTDAPDALTAGKDQAQAFADLQKELMVVCEEAGRAWTERTQTEFELWSDFGKRLTETRSVPEAVQIYQQSLTRRMQMAAEDNQKVIADCQKFAQKFARAVSPAWAGGSS